MSAGREATTAVLLAAWYCERDAPGQPTHLRDADLAQIQDRATEDAGEPDDRGGMRQRHRAGSRAVCACSCGAFLRRRLLLPAGAEAR